MVTTAVHRNIVAIVAPCGRPFCGAGRAGLEFGPALNFSPVSNDDGTCIRGSPIIHSRPPLPAAVATIKPVGQGRPPMDDTVRKISADDVNPSYNWGRALPALGPMGVDFEERVDYRRLHRYRLSRVKQALEKSDLGALLVFDVNNIRYITSTKIGEWERDKLCRWALLTRDGEPILWDFGSAAVHHKLFVPWLKP
jgi:hypothetical protein